MRAPMLVSVVISFFNEEENIPELVRRLRDVFQSQLLCDYELIFVDDASTDGSVELLKQLQKEGSDIKIVCMSRNFGVSECVMAGIKHTRGDLVVYMDADLQDPPEVIPRLVEAWRSEPGVEVVYTTRLSRSGEHPLKLWLTRFGYRILERFSNIKIVPNSGDFKLITRRAVNELVRLEEKKPFVRGLTTWIGFKQKQVTYHREARFSGKTKFPIYSQRVILNFLDSALISFSDMPLKIALFLGFSLVMISVPLMMYILYQKIAGIAEPGWSAIMVTLVVLSGIQLLGQGVQGLYLTIIYNEVKRRPNYIVKDLIGFEAVNQRKEKPQSPSSETTAIPRNPDNQPQL